jgi:fatty acid desaturase
MRITEVIDKHVLRELSAINNRVASLHLALRLGIELLLIYMLYKTQHHILLLVLTILLLGFVHSFWGYAGYAHELFHKRVFSVKWANQLLFRFSAAVTFNNRAFFEASHMRHHSKTFSDDDDEGHSFQNWSVANIIRYALFDYTFMWRKVTYTIKNACGIIPASFSTIKVNIQRAAIEVLVINGLVYLAVYFATHSGWVVLAYFVAQFSCQLPNRMLAQAQHLGLEEQKESGPLGHSRTITLPVWLAFLYANMNYHCEHHIMPSIPYYHLPELNQRLKAAGVTFEEVGVGYLFTTFWQEVGRKQQKLAL